MAQELRRHLRREGLSTVSRSRYELQWRDRPQEEAAHFNPAFCGELLVRTIGDFKKQTGGPMAARRTFENPPLATPCSFKSEAGSRRQLCPCADEQLARTQGDQRAAARCRRWTGTYSVQWIGKVTDFKVAPDKIGYRTPNVFYHNAQFAHRLGEQADIAFGIDNPFDKKAPFIQSWTDGNTDTMTYDLLRRRGYVRLSYKFN